MEAMVVELDVVVDGKLLVAMLAHMSSKSEVGTMYKNKSTKV